MPVTDISLGLPNVLKTQRLPAGGTLMAAASGVRFEF